MRPRRVIAIHADYRSYAWATECCDSMSWGSELSGMSWSWFRAAGVSRGWRPRLSNIDQGFCRSWGENTYESRTSRTRRRR